MIAIIATLVGLLLPAVQSVREAARRTQCGNNIKQIGVALHGYHASIGSLPPRYIYEDRLHHSWMTMLLPFIEQGAVHANYNFSQQMFAQRGPDKIGTPIAAFRCPSDIDSDGSVRELVDTWQIALTNYSASGGYGGKSSFLRDSTVGMFPLTRGITFAECRDGLSNTVMVGETSSVAPHGGLPETNGTQTSKKAYPKGNVRGWGFGNDIFNDGTGANYEIHPPAQLNGVAIRNCTNCPSSGPTSGNTPWCISGGDPSTDSFRKMVYAYPPVSSYVHGINSLHGGFHSQHAGGAQFVMGDGSVRYLNDQMSWPDVFEPICTIRGSELIAQDF